MESLNPTADSEINRPIFILGAHKSGTTLLRNLFDGHPDLFVVPFEMHFFKHLDRDVNYPIQRRESDGTDFADSIINSLNNEVAIANPFSDIVPEAIEQINIGEFETHVRTNYEASMSRREKCALYVRAVALATPGNTNGDRLVEKSVDNAEFATELDEIFPDASYIHIVRNPYRNAHSIFRYQRYRLGEGQDHLHATVETLKQNYDSEAANSAEIKRHKTIRFEDLVSEPEFVMQDLSGFVGIEYRDGLTRPTSLGLPWGGNSISGQKFSRVSQSPGEGDADIPIEIVEAVNERLGNYVQKFGYESIG